jgi:predicted O-linked N-acetylglucosamine transferase (SPINDLY family)
VVNKRAHHAPPRANTNRLAHRLNEAVVAIRSGSYAHAEHLLRRLAADYPSNAQILTALGRFLKDHCRYSEAVTVLRRAAVLMPGSAAHWCDLGAACQDNEDVAGALQAYSRAMEIDPRHWQVYQNLGCVLEIRKDYAQAERFYRQCTELKPDCAMAWVGIGRVSVELHKLAESVAAYMEAVRLQPTAEIYCDLAQTLYLRNRFDASLDAARHSIRLNPKLTLAHCHAGRALLKFGALSDALKEYEAALAVDPECVEAMVGFAGISAQFCRREESLGWYVRALQREPHRQGTHSGLLFTLSAGGAASHREILDAHKGWALMHGAGVRVFEHSAEHQDPARKLRIGFVSGDFYDHPVRFFIAPILRGLNREHFSVVCYYNSSYSDFATEQLRALADEWRPCLTLKDDQLAECIRGDGIDILVDLSGHTSGNRLPVFLRKPAPVQATYLGYSDTTGLPTMDYWITDWVLHPFDTQHLTSERIWRLPRCWIIYEPPANAPAVADRSTASGPITFIASNALQKVGPESIALWAKVLAAVPDSKLILKARNMSGPGEQAIIADRLSKAGVAAERVTLMGQVQTRREYLQLYGHADIALDTTPYSGGTTTAEALWMGVPVVTLRGERMVSRMSASLLSSVGLEELVARDTDDYVRIAAGLADDAARRAYLRTELRPRLAASPLCDGPGLADHFGQALRQMWIAWCTGKQQEINQ